MNIERKIKNSFEVVNAAVEGFTKQIAAQLNIYGKRGGAHSVWRQGQRNELGYANFYENFLRWLAAIYEANYIGFELLWTDLNIFVSELQHERARRLAGDDIKSLSPFPSREMLGSIGRVKGELEFLEGFLRGAR
jgi:hypothetical protein